jgi:hypothetical protein
MGIETVNKYSNMQTNNSTLRKSEVVVQSFSYTKEDYKEMWIAFTIQRGFWTTGLLEKTLNKIFKTSNIGYGEFIKKFYREFLRSDQCGPVLAEFIRKTDERFAQYYDPDSDVSNTSMVFPHTLAPMYSTFMLTLFYEYEGCKDHIKAWLLNEFPYLSESAIDKEMRSVITVSNLHTKKWDKTRLVTYSNAALDGFKGESVESVVSFMMTQMETYTKIRFLTARTFGI